MDSDHPFGGLGPTFSGPAFTLLADGRRFTPSTMTREEGGWRDGDVTVRLRVEPLGDAARSLSIEVTGVRHVEEVCLLDHDVDPAPAEVVQHVWFPLFDSQPRSTALFIRGDGAGVFASHVSPFACAAVDGAHVRAWYRPGSDVGGTFVSDPLVVGAYSIEGREIRREALPGRDIAAGVTSGTVTWIGPVPTVLDAGEVKAVRAAAAARVPWRPARAWTSHWDWGENLYRLDPAEPEVRAIYDRVAQACARIGVDVFLLAPGSRNVGHDTMEDLAQLMTGPWQNVMWLAMGEEVGHGRWRPGEEPDGVLEVIETVRRHGLTLAMYVNPQYWWLRDPEWRVVRDGDVSMFGAVGDPSQGDVGAACLAHRPVADYLIARLRDFVAAYGVGAVAFDFVQWDQCHAPNHGHGPGGESLHAQWAGYRRVLAALHEMGVEWVEGLIGHWGLAPWNCDVITHPHPSLADNQPQWMPAWPDLSQYRALGDYQRRVAYWYRNFAFTPSYKVPGQVANQPNRVAYEMDKRDPSNPDAPVAAPFRYFPVERGWDWAGSRFNLLSSIASAPSTTSFCFLPSWDEVEWKGMLDRDGEFFAHWVAFARDNAEILSRLEDLFDEPRPGAVDGTIALDDAGGGFVFLANPDFDPHEVAVKLDGGSVLRELHPVAGRMWQPGAVVVEPHEVGVYEVMPAAQLGAVALFGVEGEVDGTGNLVAARGTPGTSALAVVRSAEAAQRLRVDFPSDGVTPSLGPWHDASGAAVDLPALAGDVRIHAGWSPGAELSQLLASLTPPLLPEGDECLRPWSDPSRLRLLLELVDPQTVTPRAWVDGEEVAVSRAYMGVWENVQDPNVKTMNHLMGHYIDLHEKLAVTADLDQPWGIELALTGLTPGQLRGVRVAELPRRTTTSFSVTVVPD